VKGVLLSSWLAWLVVLVLFPSQASALTVTGTTWQVHFNLPDQSTSFSTATPEEFTLRDVLVARLDALQTNHMATLATFTFSGSNTTVGAAGPILNAMEGALNRGVALRMVVDGGVLITNRNGGSNSLAGLAARVVNPLTLVSGPASGGIMHHKLGLFDYGLTNRVVLFGSWNFTAGACSQQWNIMLEARNPELYAAYSNETAELLAGRFFSNTNKSHAHDRSAFTLPGSWQPGWVRFAPYTNSTPGGGNALTDITNLIAGAESQVVFALNSLTRMHVATQLVQACDRGVRVEGVFPLGEISPPSALNTFPAYSYLTNAANYATTNRALIRTAWAKEDFATADSGQDDLVHAKWMVLDPFGARPVVMVGSANWTAAALQDANSNDENLAFLFHPEIARAFYLHYQRMTATQLIAPWPDVWWSRGQGLWLTLTSSPVLAWSPAVTGAWTTLHGFTNGYADEMRSQSSPVGFYRLLAP
jgi:phosphatidylserine/phosphatidylglycerophosphate/cardiolipin synthase-like enzyme